VDELSSEMFTEKRQLVGTIKTPGCFVLALGSIQYLIYFIQNSVNRQMIRLLNQLGQ
jgi:hypothetical protein